MWKSFFRPSRPRLATIIAGATILAFSLAPVGASSANISHAYKTTGNVPNGSIVSLDPKRSDYVQPANTSNGARLLGVTVASGDSLLAVDSAEGATQIATSGTAAVLTSTVGGTINPGDQIGVSSFNGVGMKALPGSSVIGLAQTALNDSTPGSTSQTVTDEKGKSRQIRVGLVRVNIAIGISANSSVQAENLSGLQKIVKSITGHEVSTLRVLISLVVIVVALIALVTLIYASIYGSIISVGRNPLAKYAIFRTLGSVLGLAVLTALLTGVTLFLLLR